MHPYSINTVGVCFVQDYEILSQRNCRRRRRHRALSGVSTGLRCVHVSGHQELHISANSVAGIFNNFYTSSVVALSLNLDCFTNVQACKIMLSLIHRQVVVIISELIPCRDCSNRSIACMLLLRFCCFLETIAM